MADKNTVGAKLTAVRESRKLSLEQLAERANLEVEVVRHIESGDLVPSLAPLIRIARGLGVRLGTFLDDQESVGPVLARASEPHKVMYVSDKQHPGHSDLDFFSLAANKAGRHMEPFLIDIQPSSAQEVHLSAHEGEEFIYVMAGEVEITYGTENHRLAVGDSIYYDSIVPHSVHGAGNQPAKILAVVYAPF
jgi:transcriptional regulator with XRE-family HTH domain